MRAPSNRLPAVLSLFAASFCAFPAGADLKKAMAEPNLEKRSELALDNADAQLKAARKAYNKGDSATVSAATAEILESVELANTSLNQTGKDPRRHSKWFKRAEIDTRNLLRQLDAFRRDMSYVDRPMLDKTIARIQEIHDSLLLGLMEGKRK